MNSPGQTGAKPLCFVLMPFGIKPDPTGGPDIDFDRIYEEAIRPGIEDAGLEPLRADEEASIGIIHKPMFERLLLADFAVADLTTGNANVFYELGVRHTARPATTLTLFASHQPIPFDVGFLRSIAYETGPHNRFGGEEAQALRSGVATHLARLRERAFDAPQPDSPIFQLLGEWEPGDIARLKTDTFRDQVRYSTALKEDIAKARAAGGDEGRALLGEIENRLDFTGIEAGVLIDLFLSRRALSDWDGMIGLFERFPEVLKRQILTREQYAFALNRRAERDMNDADREKALQILLSVKDDQGANSETCGLIGRIHKSRWAKANMNDEPIEALGHLDLAIGSYLEGFRADWRDAYPGINAVTLLDIKGTDEALAQQADLLPVVRYAAQQRIESGAHDYWDYATMLELEVLGNRREQAIGYLSKALAHVREPWEPKSTADNLAMIRNARAQRGGETELVDMAVRELMKKAG